MPKRFQPRRPVFPSRRPFAGNLRRPGDLSIELLEPRRLLCGTIESNTTDCAELQSATQASESQAIESIQLDLAASELATSLDLNGDGAISHLDATFICDALNSPDLAAQILIGDANLSGHVGFDDFLTLSSNFSRTGLGFGGGDFDCSGDVGFNDFLQLSRNFGKTTEYQLPEETENDVCDEPGAQCVYPGQELYFRQVMATPSVESRTFYIQPGVHLERLDIIGRHGDQIHFLPGATVEGSVQATGAWEPDRGVVNIEASADLLITGLHATNTFQYQLQNTNGDEQSSTALTVSWSDNIELRDSVLRGSGKLTTWIQGNSTVEMTNTEIDCYYFCVGVAASTLDSQDLVLRQNNEVVPGDKHAAMWVSSTMRAPDSTFYGTSTVSFTDTTIHKSTGQGIVVGNGRYDHRSVVEFTGDTQVISSGVAAQQKDAWLPVHPNYFGISLYLAGNYPTTTHDNASLAPTGTLGRFILHEYQGTGVGPEESPLIVCDGSGCVTNHDVFPG